VLFVCSGWRCAPGCQVDDPFLSFERCPERVVLDFKDVDDASEGCSVLAERVPFLRDLLELVGEVGVGCLR
jgi:hypothetical protein